MKANQLATLVLRLMGIYCLVTLIPMIGVLNSVIFYARSGTVDGRIAVVAITFLLTASWLVSGIALIVFSRPLGAMLTTRETGDANITAVSFEQIQILAFAVAGILIFSGALPQLVSHVFALLDYLFQLRENSFRPGFESAFGRFGLSNFIGTLLKVVLGLWLFFGARGIANFWRSMRSFATPRAPES